MSYHGYLPACKKALSELTDHPPAVLEVGVDRGVSFLTLATFLARTKEQFLMVGVDVLVQEQVGIMLANLDRSDKQQAFLVQGNSLDVLPKLVEQGMKFDIFLLDGDHNYHTVSKELEHVERLVNPSGVVIIDDYDGKWSERDLWYSEREGYESVAGATKKVETEKHGVKAAVDDWLGANPEWQLSKPMGGEPVVLMRR